MPDFTSHYFTMEEKDALDYIRTRPAIFGSSARLSCREIGDGNLNYVFRISDDNNGKAVIVKQAGPVARISDEFIVSTDRNRIEYEALLEEHQHAEGLVPRVFGYDPVMNCFVMEDLSDHKIMRNALLHGIKLPLFAEHITTFMVNTLLSSSDVVLGHKEKKARVKSFINPDLCEITEDLVFTEPFYDCPRNLISDDIRPFVEQELWADSTILLETAKLKFEFMTHAQSLVHGDLHTGSIFVTPESTKVIDPEFSFYGPMGFDLGVLLANLIFAFVRTESIPEQYADKDDYQQWLIELIGEVHALFRKKLLLLWDEQAREPVTLYSGFREFYLSSILHDTAGYAGCELCRRVIGIAKVKDITSIEDPIRRSKAERLCLHIGKKLILNRSQMDSENHWLSLLTTAKEDIQ